MPLGIILFSWDPKMGSIVDSKYPLSFNLSAELTNIIYMTFAYSENYKSEELIETTYGNSTILSYCDKSRVSKVGYEIISLILEEKDKVNIYQYKKQLLDFGKKLFKVKKEERIDFFSNKISQFFKKLSTKKLLLLGRAGSGKTSIKKIIFEGFDPKDLLYNPLEPTRGLTPAVYSWLDLQLGLFDSSGQELLFLLENEDDKDHILAFENTDYFIYIIDYSFWVSKPQEITDDLSKILKLIKNKSPSSKLVVFLHKIDLISNDIFKDTITQIEKQIKKLSDVLFFSTSIHPEKIYNLYNAFYTILSSSSNETLNIKKILDNQINHLNKTMFFITNSNNSIIVQTMSKDFNTLVINFTHKLIAQLNQNFEDMSKTGKIDHLILASDKEYNIIMNNLELSNYGLKYLICISETLSANKLIWIIGQIRKKLRDLYYFNKKFK